MNFLSGIGNFLGNFFHGAAHPQPQPQRPQPQQQHPQLNLANFLGSVMHSAPVQQIEHVAPQVVHIATNPIPQVVKVARPITTPFAQQVQPVIHAAQVAGQQVVQHPNLGNAENLIKAPLGAAMAQGGRNVQAATKAVANTYAGRSIGGIRVPVIGTVGNGVNELVNQGIIQPAARAAIAGGGMLQGQKVQNPRQFVSDLAQTGLNLAGGGVGEDILKTAGKPILKRVAEAAIKSAPVNAGYGATQAFRDNANPAGYAKDIATSLAAGSALAGGGELAGAGAKAIAAQKAANIARMTQELINAGHSPADAAQLASQGGFIGGVGAQGFNKAAKSGQTFVSPLDNKVKFEGSDANVSIKNVKELQQTGQTTLGTLINHKELFNQYPQMKGLPVVVDNNMPLTQAAHFDPNTGTIHLNPAHNQTPEALLHNLVHENDHAIATHEGFAGGTNPQVAGGFNSYLNNLGEQSARDSASRMNMSNKERQANPHVAQAGGDPLVALGQVQKPKVQQAVQDSGVLTSQPVMANEVTLSAAPKTAENKFTQSVKSSPEVSPEVQQMVSGQHTVRNTKDLINSVRDQIKNEGLDNATERTLAELSSKSGTASDETLARAIEIAKAHDALGNEAGHHLAASIYDQVAEHGVASGQRSQILSIIARRSPEGLRNKAFRDLKKAGVELTPELKNEIQGHIDAIRSLPEGSARDMAIATLQKAVAKHLPQSASDKAIAIWKAGLLSGIKTQGGNFVSNATFGALKSASDPLAALIDRGISLGTGKRTVGLTAKGLMQGTKEGLGTAKTTLKTGIDPRQIGDKYEQHAEINFKSPVIQKVFGNPANMVFRGMQAADQPFFYSAFKNSLYDQAKAEGWNQNLRGDALRKFMNETVANPTETMAATAEHEANKAVLGFDTAASRAISAAHKGIDNMNAPDATKKLAHAVISVIAPFTKVPSAFLSRTVDFTPLGPVRTAFEQVARKQFNQRDLSKAIAEGMTGTGAIALGALMAKNGMLSGNYPSNDQKEQQRWKAEGITPNSIKLGNKWISLNYMGPLGLLFNAGNQFYSAQKNNSGNSLLAAAGGLTQGLMNQSFLQGFSGFSNAIQDPQRNLSSFLNSEVGSLVPSLSNDIANITDQYQRQANSPGDAIAARIPGLRENLAPKIDAFGNDLKQPSSGLDSALNPLKPSNSIDNPMLSELNRLSATDKQNNVFPVPAKTLGSGNNQIKLTPAQQVERQKMVGSELTPLWNKIMQSDGYKQLDDAHKAAALQAALTDVQSAVDHRLTQQIDPSKLSSKAPTGNTARILSGQAPTADEYVAKQLGGSSPADKYKADLAVYQAKKKAGQLSPEQDFKDQQSLGREAITSSYSNEVNQLYGMSKTELRAFFNANPNKQQLFSQVQALDKQLADNGFTSSLKFKYGLGTKTASTGGRKSSSGSSRKGSASTGYKVQLAKIAYKAPKKVKIKSAASYASTAKVKMAAPKVAKFRGTTKKVTLTA